MVEMWTHAVGWLSDGLVLPFLRLLHLEGLSGDPHEIAEALLVAALQVGIIGLLFRPLETWKPAERWTDRRLTRVDRQYTLWMLLGIFPLFTYLVLTPVSHLFSGPDAGSAAGTTEFGLAAWLPALRAQERNDDAHNQGGLNAFAQGYDEGLKHGQAVL